MNIIELLNKYEPLKREFVMYIKFLKMHSNTLPAIKLMYNQILGYVLAMKQFKMIKVSEYYYITMFIDGMYDKYTV